MADEPTLKLPTGGCVFMLVMVALLPLMLMHPAMQPLLPGGSVTWGYRWLALVALGSLLFAIVRAGWGLVALRSKAPLLRRLGMVTLGECPAIDTDLLSEVARVRAGWQLRRLPLRLLLVVTAGLPALVILWLYSRPQVGYPGPLSHAFLSVAVVHCLMLGAVAPGWLVRGIRREINAGRLGELLLTSVNPSEAVGAVLGAAYRIVLLLSLVGVPVTLVAAALSGLGIGAVLRVHLVSAILGIMVTGATVPIHDRKATFMSREIPDVTFFWPGIVLMQVIAGAPAWAGWVAVLNPVVAALAATTGEWTWGIGALFCAFLAARNFRAALREAATPGVPLWEPEGKTAVPDETPVTAIRGVVRASRDPRWPKAPPAFTSPNPMPDMEWLAGWRVGLGALPVAVWALLLQLVVVLGGSAGFGRGYWVGLIVLHVLALVALASAQVTASLRREQASGMLESLVLTRLRPRELLGAKLAVALRRSAWLWGIVLAGAGVCAALGWVDPAGGIAAVAAILVLCPAVAAVTLLLGLRWQGEALATAGVLLAAPTLLETALAMAGSTGGPLVTILSPPFAIGRALKGIPGSVPLLWGASGILLGGGLAAWHLSERLLRWPGESLYGAEQERG